MVKYLEIGYIPDFEIPFQQAECPRFSTGSARKSDIPGGRAFLIVVIETKIQTLQPTTQ